MKRVETININGIVFSIDEDAYGKLCIYLDVLNKNFESEQGGREIIADIEARVCELFAEREGGITRVVTIDDVNKAIETLGTPEDIAGVVSEETPPQNEKRQQQTQKSSKRLYRDPDNRFLGGVCSGIAAWMGISPIAVRLAFFFFTFCFFVSPFFFGISFLIYFILWLIIPKAKTTAQKLEMRGEPVNVSNIEKNIREKISDPALKQSFRDFQNEAGEFFGKTINIFGRIIGVVVGLFLFCWGIGLAIGLTCLFIMQDIVFNHKVEWDFLSFTELLQNIISPASFSILMLCAIMIVALFIFALMFWGVKMMANSKIKHKLLHVMLSLLWIAAIVTAIIVIISETSNFAWRNETIVETQHIAPSDTLYLAVSPSNLQMSNNPISDNLYFDKDNRCFYGKPGLGVQKSSDGQIKLRFNRESQGESKRAAYHYAENIAYSVDIKDSLLTFNPYFTVTPHDKWKFQTLDIVLFVPEGTVIIADNALIRTFRWRYNYGKKWIMTDNKGLQRVD